jgi:hypothetical protein
MVISNKAAVTWALTCALGLAFAAIQVSAQTSTDQKKYADCVAKVKKAYPVPPGYAGTQTQRIKLECGDPPPAS